MGLWDPRVFTSSVFHLYRGGILGLQSGTFPYKPKWPPDVRHSQPNLWWNGKVKMPLWAIWYHWISPGTLYYLQICPKSVLAGFWNKASGQDLFRPTSGNMHIPVNSVKKHSHIQGLPSPHPTPISARPSSTSPKTFTVQYVSSKF